MQWTGQENRWPSGFNNKLWYETKIVKERENTGKGGGMWVRITKPAHRGIPTFMFKGHCLIWDVSESECIKMNRIWLQRKMVRRVGLWRQKNGFR